MACWAIGDLHGCQASLETLLCRAAIDLERDTLWLVGDLVNRGPRSLEVLRWARRTADRLGRRFVCVLGNHDLHLLAVARGWGRLAATDTLGEVLAAPDRDELLAWLQRCPLLHRAGRRLLVHAGLLPDWTAEQAEQIARQLEAKLRTDEARFLLDRELQGQTSLGSEMLAAQRALAAFTRLRALAPDGGLCPSTAAPSALPPGAVAWFDAPRRRSRELVVVCGHWATLGLLQRPDLVAVDTGCVWGGTLTAVRLDDGAAVEVPAQEAEPLHPG